MEAGPRLEELQLFEAPQPVSYMNDTFTAYVVQTRNIDTVHLAYIKAYTLKPTAAAIMMAFKVGKNQGCCDDQEHKAGYRILRAIQAKKLRNIAVFVAREQAVPGQHIGAQCFKHIVSAADGVLAVVMRNEDPDAEGDISLLDLPVETVEELSDDG